MAADRPCVVEFRTDPAVPPIPPHATWDQIEKALESIVRGDTDRVDVIKEGVKAKLARVPPRPRGELSRTRCVTARGRGPPSEPRCEAVRLHRPHRRAGGRRHLRLGRDHPGPGAGARRRAGRHRLDLRLARLRRGPDQRPARARCSSVAAPLDTSPARGPAMVRRSAQHRPARHRRRWRCPRVDCALWDLKARLLGLPLHQLLGAVHDRCPLYGSGGFTTYDDAPAGGTSSPAGSTSGFPRVKIKIGESWGTRRSAVTWTGSSRPATSSAPTSSCSSTPTAATPSARPSGSAAALDALGVTWFEEPVVLRRPGRPARGPRARPGRRRGRRVRLRPRLLRAHVRRRAPSTACRSTSPGAAASPSCSASPRSRPRTSLDVSGHCAPHQHAPALAAVPNLRHLEWFHDHVRIEPLLFDGATTVLTKGRVHLADEPGNGVHWQPLAAAPYRVF